MKKLLVAATLAVFTLATSTTVSAKAKEIFSGSVKKAMELYSKYNVVSFGTNWYEDLCIYVEID